MRDKPFETGKIESRRLARGPEGNAIVLESLEGMKYVYEDGTVDQNSRVDSRVKCNIVSGIISTNKLVVLEFHPKVEFAA